MENRYPIILVHGIMMKDFRYFHSFGRIEKVLKEHGYNVISAKIDGLGTIETNAQQLKDFIKDILEKNNVDKVNLIAHSKGGLDAKYMIEHLDMAENIASLITLATPFKGSPVATSILALPKPILWIAKTFFNIAYKILGDKNPDALKACEQLALSDNLIQEVMNVENVYVESYSTELKKSSDDFVMGIPHAFCRYFCETKVSDGVVDPESAKFNNFKGNAIDGSISHTDIVDFFPNKNKKEQIYAFYLSICKRLTDLGY